jgi:hypothetical protein
MRSIAPLIALLSLLLLPSTALADAGAQPIDSLEIMHEACSGAGTASRPGLWVVQVDAGDYSLDAYDSEERFLEVDTRHNLRVLGGRARIFPAHLEPLGFPVGPSEAAALDHEVRRGAALRVGFFLGFDDPRRRACLVAPAGGVTQVRFEMAFIELRDSEGELVSRTEGDRLHAWSDDTGDVVPGQGPRGAIQAPQPIEGTLPAGLGSNLQRANAGRLGRDLARCQEQAAERGAEGSAQVLLRVTFDPRTGRVAEATVELSTLRDAAGAECVASAVRARVRTPTRSSAEALVVRLPVLLRID